MISIMDSNTMRRSVARIAYEIIERNNGVSDVVLIGILRRGAVLAKRLAARLGELEGTVVPVCELDVTPFRDDVPVRDHIACEPLGVEVEGKCVILVDDVLYTGRTVRAAIEAVFHSGRARCIQLAVLIDRGHRELPFRPDYIGKNLPSAKQERVKVTVEEYDASEGVFILREGDTLNA